VRYLLAAMLVIFCLAGVSLLWSALRSLLLLLRRLPYLVRVEGEVVALHQKRMYSSGRRGRSRIANYPVISFQNQLGETVSFRSEVGDLGQVSRYVEGQSVPVRYDPSGELSPMLDSWWASWGVPVMLACGGLGFVGGAALIWFAFGERILGG